MSCEWPIDDAVVSLVEEGLMTSCSRDGENVIRGAVEIEGRELELRIELPPDPPTQLPLISVVGGTAEDLPHVWGAGNICYVPQTGQSASLWDLEGVVHSALEMALDTLRDGFRGSNLLDLYTEAEAYWGGPGARRRAVFVGRLSSATKLYDAATRGRGSELVIGDLGTAVEWYKATDFVPCGRALLLPLEESFLREGIAPERLLEARSLWSIVSRHLSEENRKIMAARRRKRRDIHWLLVVVPQVEHGDEVVLGVEIKNLVDDPSNEENPGTVRPVHVVRRDREYLLDRGGAPTALARRSVMIVGCGSVGGHVATALARTGIGHLVLVDPDKLEESNLFRHVLGRSLLHLPKSVSLATTLEIDIPYLKAEAQTSRIQDLVKALAGCFDRHDVVVNATGDTSLSRWLNRFAHASGEPRFVHAWLEPMGVGGHALKTASHGGVGCYECLFCGQDGQETLFASSDLLAHEPGKSFTRMRGGCIGAFTPYGDLDARRTAELAVRLVLEELLHPSPEARLWTWKGDPRGLVDAGFSVSERFLETPSDFIDDGGSFASLSCPVCGRRR